MCVCVCVCVCVRVCLRVGVIDGWVVSVCNCEWVVVFRVGVFERNVSDMCIACRVPREEKNEIKSVAA